jgi:hypothetical protein
MTLIIADTFDGGYQFREIDESGQFSAVGQSHPDVDGAMLEAENYFGHVRWHQGSGVNGVMFFAREGKDY